MSNKQEMIEKLETLIESRNNPIPDLMLSPKRKKLDIGDIMLQILLPNQLISVGNYSNRRMISQSDMEIILSKFTTPASVNEPPELGEIYLLKRNKTYRIFTTISIPTEPTYEVVYISTHDGDDGYHTTNTEQIRLDISWSDTSGWPITINKDGTPTIVGIVGWFGRGELYKLNLMDYEQKTLNFSRSGFL